MMQRLLQMTLDLFEAPAAAAPAPVPRVVPVKAGRAGPPSPATAPAPAAVPASVRALVRFEHPRANRQAQFDHAVVAYEFKRAKRRTIGFVIGADGLVVSAPRWVPLAEVDAAVQDKGGWIVRKLGQSRERQQRMLAARIEWKDGAELPYLGRSVRLVLDPGHGFGAAGAQLDDSGTLLRLSLPQAATPEQIRDSVQAWLMRQAKAVFTERMEHYAPRLGVQWRRLSLSSAGTRWGSASANGSIRLHWRLIHFRLDVIDYVVVHELSHLRVMDHSPRFWDTVATVVPDYAQLRGQLRDEAIPRWG